MIFLFLLLNLSFAKPLIVVVLDSGLDISDNRFSQVLCKGNLHKDFTREGLVDTNSHGTHVSGLIKKYAENSSYCLIIVKYYSEKQTWKQNTQNYLNAIEYSLSLNPNILNISSNGPNFEEREYLAIKSHPHTLIIAASGNDKQNIDKEKTYPASYPMKNIISVGCLSKDGKTICEESNYGLSIKIWTYGEDILSTTPKNSYSKKTGTSMSTAIITGLIIKMLDIVR